MSQILNVLPSPDFGLVHDRIVLSRELGLAWIGAAYEQSCPASQDAEVSLYSRKDRLVVALAALDSVHARKSMELFDEQFENNLLTLDLSLAVLLMIFCFKSCPQTGSDTS